MEITIFGDLGVIMNLVSSKTIADVANRITEQFAICSTISWSHTPHRCRVLLRRRIHRQASLCYPITRARFFEQLRKDFDYVVVDTQSSFQDRALAVLDLPIRS